MTVKMDEYLVLLTGGQVCPYQTYLFLYVCVWEGGCVCVCEFRFWSLVCLFCLSDVYNSEMMSRGLAHMTLSVGLMLDVR